MKKPVKIAIIDTGLTERYISADTKIVESLTFATVCDGGETSELEIYRNLPLYSGTVITHDKIAEKRCGQVFHLVDGALV
jgi:hypothetical protein